MQTSTQYKGILDCVRKMNKAEGLSVYYRGIVPPLVGVGALNAVLFGTYAASKRFLSKDSEDDSLSNVFWAGKFVISTPAYQPDVIARLCRRPCLLLCHYANRVSQMQGTGTLN